MAEAKKRQHQSRDIRDEALEEIRDINYEVKADGVWRQRSVDFLLLVEDKMADVIYSMAKDGADWQHIAAFFSADVNLLKHKFTQPFSSAKAELALAIRKHTITAAFNSKMPVMTIWAGKQFAGLSDENAGLTSGIEGAVQLSVSVIRKKEDTVMLTEETVMHGLPGVVH